MNLFPDLDADDVLARVAQRWDLTGPLPVPTGGWLACPVCRSDQVQARHWFFHVRKGTPAIPWRCDVSLKCTACSVVWDHGVAVPHAMYSRPRRARDRARIGWREARTMLEG